MLMSTVLTTNAKSNACQTCLVDITANEYVINVCLVKKKANSGPTMALVDNNVDAATQHVLMCVVPHAMGKILAHHAVRIAMFAVDIRSVVGNVTSRVCLALKMNVYQLVRIANARCLVRLLVTMSHVRNGVRIFLNVVISVRRCAEKVAPLLSSVRFVATRKSKTPW